MAPDTTPEKTPMPAYVLAIREKTHDTAELATYAAEALLASPRR